jgi:uncharacterized membrane-anchored protein
MSGLRVAVVLLVLGIAAQWAVPGYLIQRGQVTLHEGTAYRFHTAPVDPVDPFRGRYVALDFEAASITLARHDPALRSGQRVYAPIRVGADGYAVLDAPLPQPPGTGDYLVATVLWINANELRLQLPFDRYYLDETLAPEAERRYWDANRLRGETDEDPRRPAWAQVRVRGGYALIEELFIEDRPVRELLREMSQGGGGRFDGSLAR